MVMQRIVLFGLNYMRPIIGSHHIFVAGLEVMRTSGLSGGLPLLGELKGDTLLHGLDLLLLGSAIAVGC